jgi:DNA-binding MarR family transcriptional regulator
MAAGEPAAMPDPREVIDLLERRELSEHLLTKVKNTALTTRAALEKEFERIGLTPPQFLALARIDEEEDISSAELARRSYVTPQAMMTIVARLAAAKLVRRVPAATGGRSLALRLTPEGRRMLERGRVHAVAIERYLLETLGAPAYSVLLTSLDRIIEALGDSVITTRSTPWQSYVAQVEPEEPIR